MERRKTKLQTTQVMADVETDTSQVNGTKKKNLLFSVIKRKIFLKVRKCRCRLFGVILQLCGIKAEIKVVT